MSINAHMRALERGCFWEAEEITPGFRGLPLPGVNSHPTLPGFSTLMGFQPGLMGAKDIRQETNKKMDSLHSRLRWIYICLSCLLPRHPFFFFLHRICTIHFKDMSIDRNYRPICCRLILYGRVSHRGSFTIKFVRSVCFWTVFNHSSYMDCWPFVKHTWFNRMFTLCVLH